MAFDSIDLLLERALRPSRRPLCFDEATLLSTGRLFGLDVGGCEVPVWSWGQGPRVLLVHGWGGRGVHLGRYMPKLVERGFSVSTFDAPAHGEASGSLTSLVHMGSAVLQVARHLGDVHALIAYAEGSLASLWAFKLGLRASSSVHLAGLSSFDLVLAKLYSSGPPNDGEQVRLRSALSSYLHHPVEALCASRLAGHLAHPGLIVHDIEDSTIPFSESQSLHDSWAHSELRQVRGVGHCRILLDSGVISDCTEFLGKHTQRAMASTSIL